MGAETYSSSSGSSKTANYAAKLCDDLTYTVNGVTYNDWFLPSKDELNLMYERRYVIGGFDNKGHYWSSSEGSYNANYAWKQYIFSGSQGDFDRYKDFRVRPVRAF